MLILNLFLKNCKIMPICNIIPLYIFPKYVNLKIDIFMPEIKVCLVWNHAY
jgi:hypothetical protein